MIDETERIRTYVRAMVVLGIMGGLGYLMAFHTGTHDDGLIQPGEWKNWLEGAAAGAIFTYYFRDKSK